VIIYYISIVFISGVYLYILYYVLHLPLLELYRRKRQLALLRRLLTLLCMLIIPGIFYIILIIQWIFVNSIPSYALKISTLIDAIAHTGVVITIFISNTRLRRQCYNRQKQIEEKRKFHRIPTENYELILLRQPKRRTTIIQSSFITEKFVENQK
jgi:hypothetical protein